MYKDFHSAVKSVKEPPDTDRLVIVYADGLASPFRYRLDTWFGETSHMVTCMCGDEFWIEFPTAIRK